MKDQKFDFVGWSVCFASCIVLLGHAVLSLGFTFVV